MGIPLPECPCEERVLLSQGMLSKRRRQGKRGNILLAMRERQRAPGIPSRENQAVPAGGMADKS
jgi:hypothetical protein